MVGLSVEDLRTHLQLYDDESYDATLFSLLEVAENYVENYIGKSMADYETVPYVVRHAVLMTAAELFEVRTESTDAKNRVAAITIDRLLAADRRIEV